MPLADCIQKSSAELSEAINSMYQWYENAKECYVFLGDLGSPEDSQDSLGDAMPSDDSIDAGGLQHTRKSAETPFEPGPTLEEGISDRLTLLNVSASTYNPQKFSTEGFAKSSWFTRGWTLQELLAPQNVRFFDKHYHYIGSKQELSQEISTITGIGHEYLTLRRPVEQASVGVRMRWASRRECTRKEDLSYCLMGLFGVNMPLLYGEGAKAFVRLQLEITKKLHDESLFGWYRQQTNGWRLTPSGDPQYSMLASSAAAFAATQKDDVIHQDLVKSTFRYRHPYSMTNKGFELKLDLPSERMDKLTLESYHRSRFWLILPLNCLAVTRRTDGTRTAHRIALRLSIFYLGIERRAIYATIKDRLLSAKDQPERLEDFGVEDDEHCLGAVGLEKPVEYFKVYIIQDGV